MLLPKQALSAELQAAHLVNKLTVSVDTRPIVASASKRMSRTHRCLNWSGVVSVNSLQMPVLPSRPGARSALCERALVHSAPRTGWHVRTCTSAALDYVPGVSGRVDA